MIDDSLTVETIAPWDGRRVPVTLIGGYLGAGKTTAINEFLRRTDRPVAVLVNDVGEINIDSALIKRRHSDTLELTDGCVCCSLAEGLANAFDSLRARPEAPDHVVLELSGVANPARVAPWADSDGFRLDGIIVLIDTEQFLDRIDDERTMSFIRAQLGAADVFVLTKTDIVDPAQVAAVDLDRWSPTCRFVVPAPHMTPERFSTWAPAARVASLTLPQPNCSIRIPLRRIHCGNQYLKKSFTLCSTNFRPIP